MRPVSSEFATAKGEKWQLDGRESLDWSQLPDDLELHVSKVNLFGAGSSAYGWARLAAMVMRAQHCLLGPLLASWLLLLADDGKMNAPMIWKETK